MKEITVYLDDTEDANVIEMLKSVRNITAFIKYVVRYYAYKSDSPEEDSVSSIYMKDAFVNATGPQKRGPKKGAKLPKAAAAAVIEEPVVSSPAESVKAVPTPAKTKKAPETQEPEAEKNIHFDFNGDDDDEEDEVAAMMMSMGVL